jgi:hypothetical protein
LKDTTKRKSLKRSRLPGPLLPWIFAVPGNTAARWGPLCRDAHHPHHHYAISERQVYYRWEIDITCYLLRLLSWYGIARIPQAARESDRIDSPIIM